MRSGIANLPLHGGKCPAWLFEEMTKLGRSIVEAIAYEYGPAEVLKRLSDPYWFQAFGCVLGFDWHSSGLTTTVCGALKEGLKPLQSELGVFFAGGKGKTSRKTPEEIDLIGEKVGLSCDPEQLKYASRMAAKIDSNALQDGFQIYHHFFVFTKDGQWTVIQQGMNEETRYARRYHWLSTLTDSFVCEPHAAVTCDITAPGLNLVAAESNGARNVITTLSNESPEKTVNLLKKINDLSKTQGKKVTIKQPAIDQLSIFSSDSDTFIGLPREMPALSMPSHHHVPISAQLKRALESAYDRQPDSFETLVATPGVGAGSLRALALVAEIIHGVEPSHRDPVRYSFAHGGKDGHPFPVDRQAYKNSVESLEGALSSAKLGDLAKIKAFKKLSQLQRSLKW